MDIRNQKCPHCKGTGLKRSYVNEFISLKCAGDVLNIVNPLGSKSAKEITESMGMIRQIKRIALVEPMKYQVVDFCAGNALTSVLSVFLLPVTNAIAIDKRKRTRKWHLAKRFIYHNADINEPWHTDTPSIFIAGHACGELARRVIDLYLRIDSARHLVLMPCCEAGLNGIDKIIPHGILSKIDRYSKWSWSLAIQAGGDFIYDINILSPKNAIVIAHKAGA